MTGLRHRTFPPRPNFKKKRKWEIFPTGGDRGSAGLLVLGSPPPPPPPGREERRRPVQRGGATRDG